MMASDDRFRTIRRGLASLAVVAAVISPPLAAGAGERPAERFASDAAARERATILQRLAASGRAERVWERRARALREAFARRTKATSVAASVVSTRCFRLGCAFELRHRSDEAAQRAEEVLTALEEYQTWPGTRYRSPPFTAKGVPAVTWVLLTD